jgi:hypothetical protein
VAGNPAFSSGRPVAFDKSLMEKENSPELSALASYLSVELPGIETDALPGVLASDLPVRSISVQFSPARYLRLCLRVLTASRPVNQVAPSETTSESRLFGERGIYQRAGCLSCV